MNLYAFSFLAATWVLLVLGTFVFSKDVRNHLHISFFILVVGAAYWAITEALLQISETPETAYFWHKVGVFWPITISLFLHFTLVYTEKVERLNDKISYIFLLIYLPSILISLFDGITDRISAPPTKAIWGWNESPPISDISILSFIDLIWAVCLALIALFICIHYFITLTDYTKKQQTKYVLIGLVLPVGIGIVTEAIFPVLQIEFLELTVPTFALSCIAIGYAILKYQLFLLSPANAAETILTKMSDLLFLSTPDGIIRRVNPIVLDLLGFEEEELIDQPLTMLFGNETDEKLLFKNRTGESQKWPVQFHDVETVIITKEQKAVPISLSNSILRSPTGTITGVVYLARNIAERKRTEAALKESEIKYSALVENAKDGVLIAQGRVAVFVNSALAVLTGYSVEEIIGMPFLDLIAPTKKAAILYYYDLRMKGVKVPNLHETQLLHKDGTVKDVELTASMVQYNGHPAAMDVVRDITERKQAETILQHAKEELELRVQERTKELRLMNEKLQREISERKLAESTIQYRLQIEQVLSELSATFVGKSDLSEAMNNALAQIGKLMRVDRTYVYLFNGYRSDMSLMYEWCNIGVRPNKEKLQNLPINQFPWWMHQIEKESFIKIEDVSQMPNDAQIERSALELIDTKALFILPLYQDLEFCGFLGISDLQQIRKWRKEDLRILRICSEIISWAFTRQNAEVALRTSEERYRLLAENVFDIIWTSNLQLEFTFVSPSITSMLGYRPTELVNQPMETIMTSDSFQNVKAAFNIAQHLEDLNKNARYQSRILELELVHKNKSTIWTETTVSFLRDLNEQPIGFLGVTRDVSLRKLAEQEKANLDRRRSNFIEITSHEIRTPLTAIKGYTELLERGVDDLPLEKRTKYIDAITRNILRLERLIHGVSALGQLERNVFRLNMTDLEFNSFFTEALRPYQIFLGQQLEIWGIAIKTPVFINGDPDRLLQVIDNLIDNAVKNSSKDTRKVLITAKILPTTVSISISDNGGGIAEEDLERIFAPFITIPTDYHAQGTGIGLYLSREIIEAHHGTLTAHSTGKNQGATFIIELPRKDN